MDYDTRKEPKNTYNGFVMKSMGLTVCAILGLCIVLSTAVLLLSFSASLIVCLLVKITAKSLSLKSSSLTLVIAGNKSDNCTNLSYAEFIRVLNSQSLKSANGSTPIRHSPRPITTANMYSKPKQTASAFTFISRGGEHKNA